jgi:hypothetical protein
MVKIKYHPELLERMKKAKKEGKCVDCIKKQWAREQSQKVLRPEQHRSP